MLAACGGGSGPEERLATESTQAPYLPLMGQARQGKRAPLAASAAAPLPSPDQLMNWAERSYAALFPGPQTTLTSGALVYRFYPQSGNYLGVLGQDVLALGPPTGNQVVTVGTLAQFAEVVATQSAISDEQAARFLLHAQIAASDEDIASVRSLGYEGWLESQFALPPGETTWDWLEQRGYGTVDRQQYYNGGHPYFELAANRQLFTTPDALRKRIQVTLTEYFVVSVSGTLIPWPHFAYATYWDGLGSHAFGNFRDLLEHVTLCVAMGIYLNTAGNQKEDPATGRVPDENYAREVMQLFTIGLYELAPDGSLRLDAQGRPMETYRADDVTQLARVFTGYDLDRSGPMFQSLVGNQQLPTHPYTRRPMRFDASRHSTLEARFLGTTVPAGTPGPQALKIALDTLFNHANVGPFFGRQLIQRLVTSHPSPAYVGRVAAAFANNGRGVRGDMRAVIRAVLLDDEARGDAGLVSPTFGKLREPALRLLQWVRTFRMVSRAGSWKWGRPYGDSDADFGQRLFWSPSVFNFFRPGYVPPGTALADRGMTAPEFQIVNEASVAQYVNVLHQQLLLGPYIFAPERRDNDRTEPSPQSGIGDMVPDYSREADIAHNATALVDRLALLMCAGQLSAATRTRIVAALETRPLAADSPPVDKQAQVALALILLMVSPEYLVQK